MYVIGVDPSPRRSGLAKLEVARSLNGSQPRILNVLECAIVESDKDTDILDIVTAVHEQLLELLAGKVLPVYLEVPIHGRNAGVLIQQGFLIGGVSVRLNLEGIRPMYVHPMQVKALLGIPKTPKGQKTDKRLVVKAVRDRVGDPDFLADDIKVNREAVCDAIGIALVGVFLEE